jgi:hypothetical protein
VCKTAYNNNMLKSLELNDPQVELLLLRCCSGAPRMMYWLRTCKEFNQKKFMIIINTKIRDDIRLCEECSSY